MKIIIAAIATATILFTSCTKKQSKTTDNNVQTTSEIQSETTSPKPLLAQLDTSLEAPVASLYYVNATSASPYDQERIYAQKRY